MTDREQDREALTDEQVCSVLDANGWVGMPTEQVVMALQHAARLGAAAAAERIAELESITPLGYEEAKKFYDEWPGGLDEIQASVEGWNRIHKEQEARIAQLERERDEARADAERLRALINTPQTDDWLTAMRPGIDEAAIRARKEGS